MTNELWHKQRLYGERDTVLWAIIEGANAIEGKVIGSALLEADADRIIADHALAQWAREHGQPALATIADKHSLSDYHRYCLEMQTHVTAREALDAYPIQQQEPTGTAEK